MATTGEHTEVEELRARVQALERERLELIERTNAAIAAAEERAYWLDRWQVDLNAVMRRRGMGELRALLRALRGVVRAARHLWWRTRG